MPASVARSLCSLSLAMFIGATPARAEPAACVAKEGPDACTQKCEAKSQQSCAVLGVMYLRGKVGGKQDFARAEPLLRRACDAKVALGCGGLGSLLGVRGDFEKARPLFEKACTMGDALSCESLGGQEIGAVGGKPPVDPTAAARRANVYYKRACALGSGTACGFCAAFIADKIVEGTAKDALELYVKACSSGMAIACRHAADLLLEDTPDARELAAGYDTPRLTGDLLARACKLGDAKACERTGHRK